MQEKWLKKLFKRFAIKYFILTNKTVVVLSSNIVRTFCCTLLTDAHFTYGFFTKTRTFVLRAKVWYRLSRKSSPADRSVLIRSSGRLAGAANRPTQILKSSEHPISSRSMVDPKKSCVTEARNIIGSWRGVAWRHVSLGNGRKLYERAPIHPFECCVYMYNIATVMRLLRRPWKNYITG